MVLMEEKKLTALGAGPNTVANSSSQRSVSESRATEYIFGEHSAAGCQTMGASIQPTRGNSDAVKAPKEPPKRDDSYPSSLRSTSTSCSSYSLEISVSTTNNSDKECKPLPLKTPPESRDGKHHELKPPSPLVCQTAGHSVTKSFRPSDPQPLQEKEQLEKFKSTQCQDKHGSSEIVTAKSPSTESSHSGDGKVEAQPGSASVQPTAASTQDFGKSDRLSTETRAGLEDEDMFYAFVILHAQEDTEEAVRLKSRFESISSSTGATFSEDFAVPGQSIFRSVEDAIDNSAFVMLLLTPNFNTRLNETNTDSALMNSIDKSHKSNTVIPLLPRTNGLTRDQMPYALKTINPLDETRDRDNFEKKALKLLDSKKIEAQKSMWRQAQLVKNQQKKQQMLQEEVRYRKDFIREDSRVRELQEELQQLKKQQQPLFPPPPNLCQGFPARPPSFGPMPFQNQNMWQPPASNIHIQNAKCIMIGNNSTMTVGGCVDSGDEDYS